MFKRWLDKKLSASQRGEAERFYLGLIGAPSGALDGISAAQMYWAAFYQERGVDFYQMEDWIAEDIGFTMRTISIVKGLQKDGSAASATGLMVWLHSARALVWPELRHQGRLMWQELSKASDESDKIAYRICAAAGISPLNFDRQRIPQGLERLDR